MNSASKEAATFLTVGETMVVAATSPGTPLRRASHLRLSSAGAEATVAIGMRRLGHRSTWIGTVGTDALGERVVSDLNAERVDTRFVRTVRGYPTGLMLRDSRTPDYVNVMYYRAGLAGAQVGPLDVEGAFLALGQIDILHVTGITPLLSPECRAAVERAIELAHGQGALVSFDVNYRRALATESEAASDARYFTSKADLLFVGDDELHLLTNELEPSTAAQALIATGPQEVVVKLGVQGAFAATADGRSASMPALKVSVLDTIGAGDSFVAGYLAAQAHGYDVSDRLRWGTICAACTVGTFGDWEGIPVREEIDNRDTVGRTNR